MSIHWGGRGPGHLSRWSRAGGGFSPVELFEGTDGAWFPQDDLSAYFLTNLGSVNVSANDDTIGLALDKHLMGGLSASAFIAGQAVTTLASFSLSTTGGTASATESPTGTVNVRGDGTNTALADKSMSTTVGRWYRITFNASATVSGATFRVGTASGGSQNIAASAIAAGLNTYWFVATATTTYFRFANSNVTMVSCSAIDVKEVPGNHASQSTASFRPKYKTATTSRKYDGADDYLAGTAKCGASGNTLAAKVTVPASLAGVQVISGLNGASGDRWFLCINSSGQLCAGVGAQNTNVIVGTTDVRGLTGVATLIEDGSTVYLYWNGNLEYSGARSGAPNTSVTYFEGAYNNNNGGPGAFFSGEIFDRITLQRAITADERAKLLNFWS